MKKILLSLAFLVIFLSVAACTSFSAGNATGVKTGCGPNLDQHCYQKAPWDHH